MEYTGSSLLRSRCFPANVPIAGPNSLFIRVLLDKKYALPYKVVDALVFHFIRFKRDPRIMPVLWHQSFLVFVQRSVPLFLLSVPFLTPATQVQAGLDGGAKGRPARGLARETSSADHA